MATVSISTLFGENGLIKKAQEAKDHQSNAVAMEEGQLDKAAAGAANLIASDGNGGSSPTEPTLPESGPGSKMEKPDSWTSDKVIPINDGTGTTIPLPDGFDYVGGRQKYRIGNFR